MLLVTEGYKNSSPIFSFVLILMSTMPIVLSFLNLKSFYTCENSLLAALSASLSLSSSTSSSSEESFPSSTFFYVSFLTREDKLLASLVGEPIIKRNHKCGLYKGIILFLYSKT